MKTLFKSVSALCFLAIIFSCSSGVKVLTSWKADNAGDIKDNELLVIARTDNKSARIAFENEIVAELENKGYKAKASFNVFPKLNPDQKLTESEQIEIKNKLIDAGYNGVVLTVIKQVEDVEETTVQENYYVGGNFYGYYPRHYGRFGGYYYNPMSYSSFGNYVGGDVSTRTYQNFILETVVYDLDNEGENELVTVVTTRINDPDTATKIAKKYASAISKSLEK